MTTEMLRGEGVCMRFGGVHALREVDVALAPGRRLGLIGPNGSGKTTLLNVLSGVYRASAGAIRFGERPIERLGPGARARLGIVRTFQHPQLAASLTIAENVRLGAALGRRVRGSSAAEEAARSEAALERFGCAAYAEGLPDEVPYGVRKMAEVARGAAADPAVLLLDEPAAGLSREERAELIAAIEAYCGDHPQVAVCLVEHDVPLVTALCPELLVLAAGQALASGPAEEVVRDEQVRVAYLGENVQVGSKEEVR
ncbi:ABC transporter ATP-binding protein [Conexibacter arvalis]|uniref:ABC-type branched-subunit amino acid transport system ATPase component n=1 Tax=Conexibacter arvalis TaxID=912552 RepID=A0A840IIX8_9ACTN|nr:ATP-binding cassette domain-containing protein [Conexibacter arvalis]MBB4663878.1 ABC-type branched-subunit amino acid transport system ATPase component [Conexibacter arvalis]